MKYINKDDLITIIQERLMSESVAMPEVTNIEENTILDDIELKTIDLVISYISGTYNCDLIFAELPIRNGVLVQIIASIVVYRSVKRNAARKVPEDYVELYKEAIKFLERIQSGAMALVDCPKLTTEEGGSISPVWGNNTNKDFFI
ncbi:MAG: hypothetical protein A2W90_17955 [Bacteroidetes bacterium GWF2_42_66]|nr:MAG: hypothetical protein A2W92_22215 [Bacteroidetes bacterium GWA2_42_15]OFX98136.1 MAG: hypothetical protein A2W89_09445 [Bacteroidetes bacterium GWE2_42_39]OFY42521.1 MAG: hypothetical protein A2W90_17955 [Bacteroidetes bacterium GWF2_42_66]HBL74237.1 hypothetical protein [Prolixibacteraceae bacterium]HCU64006.1 hypothetical protein [Prolixibacteraceae bacterium]